MAKRCGLCGLSADDEAAFSEHMRTTHRWGGQSVAQNPDRFMHPALLVPCLLLWPIGVPVMLVLFLRHRDHGLDLRKLDHVLAVATVPLMVMLIVRADCLVLRCTGDFQIDSFTRGFEWVGTIGILSGLVALARWMRTRSVAAPSEAARVAPGASGRAAATLPSGRVLVFDANGVVIESASGQFETVKHRVFQDLHAEGKFFWIHTSGDAFWEGNNLANPDGQGRGYVPFFQVDISVIETTAADWLNGGRNGQPGARTSIVFTESEKREIGASDIWKLIREAALAAVASRERRNIAAADRVPGATPPGDHRA